MGRLAASAAYRIAFTYSAVFTFAVLILGIAVYVTAHAEFRHQQDTTILQESTGLVALYRNEGMARLRTAIVSRESRSATNAFGYALFDGHGRRIAGALDTERPALGWHNIIFIDPQEGPDLARALVIGFPHDMRLVIAADTEGLERIDATILALFGAAAVLMLAIGSVGAVLLGTYLRNRLDRISGTAQAIMQGRLESRVPVGARADEFDQLAIALNAMLDRIAQLLDNLRQVSSDVAHDLRTPLARLRGQLEAAMTSAGSGPNQIALGRALSQSDELLALFAAILRISEIEGGALANSFKRTDLSALVGDLCESYQPAVSDGGRNLAFAVAPGITIQGDKELLAQALINLLDNAQHHTPPGTQITVLLEMADDQVRLAVADDGPGVAEADRAHVVRRFGRLDSSRATAGHGLGLNLVAAVVRIHQGEMVLGDNHPGLRVTLILPGNGR